jgi:hypothetical protein
MITDNPQKDKKKKKKRLSSITITDNQDLKIRDKILIQNNFARIRVAQPLAIII